MAMSRNHKAERVPRRDFLAKSALGGSVLLGMGNSAHSADAPIQGNSADLQDGRADLSAPSNALVTGIDPDEMVLFAFDDHSIPLRKNLDLRLDQPSYFEKNPVLRLGKRGEVDALWAAFFGTVFYLDGKFHMWYGAVDNAEEFLRSRTNMRLAYAQSDDGMDWVKPKLGLREFKGNKANNLCGFDRECYMCLVLHELEEPDLAKRFKMVYTGYHHPGVPHIDGTEYCPSRLCVAYSPDGLRWVDHPGNPVVPSFTSEGGGLYRWKGIYYANGQTPYPPKNAKRTMVSFASPDLETWADAGIVSFRRPEPKPFIHRGRQVHTGASVWHRRNVLLGLYGQWEGPESNKYVDVRMNLGLVISNDGLLFREPVPDYPFMPWGKEKSDWKTLRLLQGQGFVNHGEMTYIFYGAGSGDFYPVEADGMVGLATLPRDRFGHLRPHGAGALWISNALPAIPNGAELAVNVDGLGDHAQLRVEVLDSRFQPISGRSGDQAAVVRKAGLRQVISWPQGESLATDQSWRLRIHFDGKAAQNIRFYALYIREMVM